MITEETEAKADLIKKYGQDEDLVKERCKTCERVVAREEITETGCIICNEQDEGGRYEEMKEEQMGIPDEN